MEIKAYHAIRAAKGIKLWGFNAANLYRKKQGISIYLFLLAHALELQMYQ